MPDDRPRRFRVVDGDGRPRPGHGDGLCKTTCTACERHDGVATAGPWIAATMSLWEQDGAVVETGEKAWFCLPCLARGRVTRVF